MTESMRRDRHLGWITLNGQEYPRGKAADWLDAIKKGLCPFCGAGPFTVPAGHVTRRHGISAFELRDLLGLPQDKSICDEFHSKERSLHAKDHAARRDMSALSKLKTGGTKRKTSVETAAKALQRKPRECAVCGVDLGRDTHRTTCSAECKSRLFASLDYAKRGTEMVSLTCPVCSVTFERPASYERRQRAVGYASICCSRSCAAASKHL